MSRKNNTFESEHVIEAAQFAFGIILPADQLPHWTSVVWGYDEMLECPFVQVFGIKVAEEEVCGEIDIVKDEVVWEWSTKAVMGTKVSVHAIDGFITCLKQLACGTAV